MIKAKINKTWHEVNRMPKKPSHEQRMNWHLAHLKNCQCRKPSAKLVEQLKEFAQRRGKSDI